MTTTTKWTAREVNALSLHAIAKIIGKDWPKVKEEGTPSDFGNIGQHPANPYWQAMSAMTHINDKFGLDSGTEIVARFLGNAGSWRGEQAKIIKHELRTRLEDARRARA